MRRTIMRQGAPRQYAWRIASFLSFRETTFCTFSVTKNLVQPCAGQSGPVFSSEERSVGDVNLLLKLVDAIPFFAQIPIGAVKRMCTAMTYKSLHAGEVLFRQGDEGDSFYIVLSGRLQVNVVDEEVMVKKGGQVRAALVSSGDKDSYLGHV